MILIDLDTQHLVYSSFFDQNSARKVLFDIFTQCHGKGDDLLFTTSELGLWASFLSRLGVTAEQYSNIKHRLIENSFLNISCDGRQIIKERLLPQCRLAEQNHNIDCLMLPCLRQANLPQLEDMGFTCIPGFSTSLAIFEQDWQNQFSSEKPKYFKRFVKEIRCLEDHYQTQWLALKDFVSQGKVFEQAIDIYMENTSRFDNPAIHYSNEVLEAIAKSECRDFFKIALTKVNDRLVKMVVCAVDVKTRYIAALVHGIDYNSVLAPTHNLYKHIYYDVYQYMAKHQLRCFDMGRGYAEAKQKLGANKEVPLFVYLKPLNTNAEKYVKTIKILTARSA